MGERPNTAVHVRWRVGGIVATVAAVILGAITIRWWPHPKAASRVEVNSEEQGADSVSVLSGARKRDPVGYVATLAGKHDPATVSQLVQIYSQWAAFPEALEARKLALDALLAHPNINIALEAVLSAVDGDQTRRQQDPMWRYLVAGVGKLWDAVTFPLGRNRMYTEERAKPRDLLLESLASVSPERLSDTQRTQLASDFIDLYPGLSPEQRPAAERALTALGGPDLVDILGGRGLVGEGSKLKVVADRNRAIEAARAIPPPPPTPDDDVVSSESGPKTTP